MGAGREQNGQRTIGRGLADLEPGGGGIDALNILTPFLDPVLWHGSTWSCDSMCHGDLPPGKGLTSRSYLEETSATVVVPQ